MFALISIILAIDYSLLFIEDSSPNSIYSIKNSMENFVELQFEGIKSGFSFVQFASPTKITGKSINTKTQESVYVAEKHGNKGDEDLGTRKEENQETEKQGDILALGVNGNYIDVVSQTSSMNVSKGKFFNFSVSVRCKSSCSNVVLILDPHESNAKPTRSELDYAKQEIEKIRENIKEKNLEWNPEITEFYLEYIRRKLAGEEHPFAMTEPETPSLLEILSDAKSKATLMKIASAATGSQEKVLPYYINWKNMYNEDWTTPVKSQGSCNGCWAFGAVAVAESAQMIYNKMPGIDINLAEQELISCGGGGSCASGGGDYQALGYIMNNGVVNETCFPYVASDIPCNRCSYTKKYYIKERVSLYEFDKEGIKRENAIQYLLRYGPASAQMRVYNDFPAYRSGIYEPSTGSYSGLHIVNVIGYNKTGDYLIIKNSWGTSWGMAGYGYIKSWVLLNDSTVWNRLYHANGTEKISKGVIPMNSGTPFYTITQNPYNCGNLSAGQTCNVTWQVNATGFHDSSWNFFVIINSNEENFKSEDSIITIKGNEIPEIQNIECKVNDIWKACNETSLGNITQIRVNVTDLDNSISNVGIRLKENDAIVNEETAVIENGFYIINTSKKVQISTKYTIEVDVYDNYWINGFIEWKSPETCIEDWIVQYGSCMINDTKLKYYIDSNSCGTSNNLPIDNGTYVYCDYCAPNWQEINTTCQPGDFKIGWYNDSNQCFAQTGLPSDNNPPANNTYWCNYENDAPVLEPIGNITVYEGQLIQINPKASDADNDTLIFSFTPPLNSSGAWKTSIGDNGNYSVNVSVSDGNLTDSQIVWIFVLVDAIPGSIQNLTVHEKDKDWIYWNWLNPSDFDFANNIVYLNGINVINTTNNFYRATSLKQNEVYTITIHTIDLNGNINNTDVSNTARTCLEMCSFGKCHKLCV